MIDITCLNLDACSMLKIKIKTTLKSSNQLAQITKNTTIFVVSLSIKY